MAEEISQNEFAIQLPQKELLELETSEKLEEILTENEEKMFVLFFHADWCGACENILPFLQNIATENPDVEIIKIDVDVHEPLVVSYELLAIPTFVFLRGKKIITKSLGANEKTFSIAFDKLKKKDDDSNPEQPSTVKSETEKSQKSEPEKSQKPDKSPKHDKPKK